jgi:hypothetical protein
MGRRGLRRGGVLAGAAALLAGALAKAAERVARAADGEPLLLGRENAATGTTVLARTSPGLDTDDALRVTNQAAGPAGNLTGVGVAVRGGTGVAVTGVGVGITVRAEGTAMRAEGADNGLSVVGHRRVGVEAAGGVIGVWARTSGGPAATAVVASGVTAGVEADGGIVGVAGSSGGGTGVRGFSGTGAGVAAEGAVGVAARGRTGVTADGDSLGVAATGRAADSTGVAARGGSIGVAGSAAGGTGVAGTSTTGAGVSGESPAGTGVYGASATGTGVWATCPEGIALYATSAAYLAARFDGQVEINGPLVVRGDLAVLGPPTAAAVAAPDGSLRRLYALASPEGWVEDFGEGQLVAGQAQVRLDPEFAALVRGDAYHVFLTPGGDSRGLYVAYKGPTGFAVQEQQGGTSSPPFGYRVVAKRRDAARPRLERLPPRPARPAPAAPAAPRPVELPPQPDLPELPPLPDLPWGPEGPGVPPGQRRSG